MSRTFEITAPAERVRLGQDGRGQMVFSVTNRSNVVERVTTSFAPSGATRAEWLSLSGEPQRELSAGATDQLIVEAQFPPATPAGAYPFRLRISSANNRTSEEYDESPLVTFEMPAVAMPKKRPWWIFAAAAAVLLVVIVAVILLTKSRGPEVPDVVKKEAVEAIRAVQSAKLATQLAFAVDPSVEKGHVIRTDPKAGTRVDEGSSVLLTIARETAGNFQLQGNDTTQLSDTAAQQLAQFITAGAPPPPPSQEVQVPSLIGQPVVDAMLTLQNTPLNAKLLTFTTASIVPNIVLQQSPLAGTKVAKNSEVTLVLAQPRRFIPIDVRPGLSPEMMRQIQVFNQGDAHQ